MKVASPKPRQHGSLEDLFIPALHPDPYTRLGVTPRASREEIIEAFETKSILLEGYFHSIRRDRLDENRDDFDHYIETLVTTARGKVEEAGVVLSNPIGRVLWDNHLSEKRAQEEQSIHRGPSFFGRVYQAFRSIQAIFR